MEENKNIDKFFKDRLETDNAPEWATPSDDIWMSAKSRFNKKEKRKKGFVFWLLGSGVVILSIVSLVTIIYNQKNENVERNQFADQVKQIENNKIETKQIENSDALNLNPVNISNAKSEKEIITDNLSKKIEPQKVYKDEPDRKSTNELGEYVVEEKLTKRVIDKNIKLGIQSLKNTSEILDQGNLKSQEIFTNQLDSELSVSDGVVTDKMPPLKLNSVINVNDKIIPLIELLPRQGNLVKVSNNSEVDKPELSALLSAASPVILEQPKYELGLSHSKYLIGVLFESGVVDDEEAELSNIDFSIKNINVTTRKWINRKWSYSIGANLSKLNINTDIELLDTLDEELNNFISDNYTISSRSLKSGDSNIELIDGVELMIGDIINVKGNVDLNVTAVQFPFIMDYHIYRNKMEFMFGSGLSIDLLQFTQGEIDISIFKDQQLVNKPFIQERFSEFAFDYSVYANFGMKYHIHKNWNVGLSTKLSVLEPVFSYAELGIYYRWHK